MSLPRKSAGAETAETVEESGKKSGSE